MHRKKIIYEIGTSAGRLGALFSDPRMQYHAFSAGEDPACPVIDDATGLYLLFDGDVFPPERLAALAGRFRFHGARQLLFADKPDAALYANARRQGIALVAETDWVRQHPLQIFRSPRKTREREGVVLLFDQDEARIALVREIFSVFTHELRCIRPGLPLLTHCKKNLPEF